MEARGALLSDESYAPPVYDEVAGIIRSAPQAQERQQEQQQQRQQQRPPGGRAPWVGRSGVSRGAGGDEYVALESDDGPVHDTTSGRANEIAMRRQQEHAAAFKRQIEAEEEFLRSSQAQMQRDADLAAQLAQGSDEAANMEAVRQAQRDAEIARRLQQEYNNQQPRNASSQQVSRKTVRVVVPSSARPGDSLSVSTPSTGKFEVSVPSWARPNTHFDCVVTTTVQVCRPGEKPATTAQDGLYQPPPVDLPPGWERGFDANGVPFYVDHNTRTTHWRPPPPTAAPQPNCDPTSGMTEEEMLAEAIARSLIDSPSEGNDQPSCQQEPPPKQEQVISDTPPFHAPEPDLLSFQDPPQADSTGPPASDPSLSSASNDPGGNDSGSTHCGGNDSGGND